MSTVLTRRNVLTVAALMLVTLLSGCASGPTIISNADPSVDFMAIRSFDFLTPLSTDRGSTRTLLSTQLINETTAQLQARGWRRDTGNPEVLVNFLLETQEQIRSRQTSASVGMHRSGRYGMWGGTMSTPTIETVTQGMLSIDMIDPQRNQLIWEGSATNRVTDEIRRNQADAVQAFVAEIFRKFP